MVVGVSRSAVHGFTKDAVGEIRIVGGLGVEGDAHAGATVRHRYRVRKDPTAANLCQVHLLQAELFAELAGKGMAVRPGEMGENVTTQGMDLLALPVGARLFLGQTAVVEVTGLRDPCAQLNGLLPGLMKACIAKDMAGKVLRKVGIMGIALVGGVVRAGDPIRVELPVGKWQQMGPV
jgi:MOSC domain-containing protein YiiM